MAILSLAERSIKSYVKADVASTFTGGTVTFTVDPGQGSRFPAVPFALVLYDLSYADPSDAAEQGRAETVLCTARVADTLTVVRGIEGTVPFAAETGRHYRFLLDATSGYLDNVPRYLNLRTYGAKIDGATNDTQAFLDAKSDLPATGGTIFVPRGSGPLILSQNQITFASSNFALIGEPGAKIKGAAGADSTSVLFKIYGTPSTRISDVLVRDLEIDGNAGGASITSGTQAHIFDLKDCDRVTIKNCYLHDSPGDSIRLTYEDGASGPRDVFILNNRMQTCYRNHVSITIGERITVDNNAMLGFNTVGIDVEPNSDVIVCKDITISKNHLTPAPTWINVNNSNRLHGIQCKNGTAPAIDGMSHAKIIGNTIVGLDDGGTQYPAFGISGVRWRALTIVGNQTYRVRQGISTGSDPGASNTVYDGCTGEISGNHVKDCISVTGGIGIQCVAHMVVQGNTVEGCEGAGIRISGRAVSVVANKCRGNGKGGLDASTTRPAGIWIQGTDCAVFGNLCEEEYVKNAVSFSKSGTTVTVTHTAHGYSTAMKVRLSGLGDTTYGKNAVDGGVWDITVIDPDTYTYVVPVEPTNASTTGNAGRPIQQYGIYLEDGAANNLISENNVRQNLIQGVRIPSPIGDNDVRSNTGFVTEFRGTGSIASGSTNAVVEHLCERTPGAHEIRVSFTNNPTNDIGHVWFTSIGATTFQVNCKVAPGGSGATFSWAVGQRSFG